MFWDPFTIYGYERCRDIYLSRTVLSLWCVLLCLFLMIFKQFSLQFLCHLWILQLLTLTGVAFWVALAIQYGDRYMNSPFKYFSRHRKKMVSGCAFLFLLRLQDRWFARYLLFLLNTSNSIHETKLTSAVWFACLFTRSRLVTRSFSIDHVRAFDYFITSRHPKFVDGLYLAHENHWSDVRVDAHFIIPLFALRVCPNVHMAAIFPASAKVVGLAKCPVRIQRRIRIIDPRKRFIGRPTEQSNPHKSWKKKKRNLQYSGTLFSSKGQSISRHFCCF